MRIYISTDMEGISGISSPDYVLKDGRFWAAGQRLLTADINAAVRGCFDGGADEVIVADVHSNWGNMLVEELDPRALYIVGTPHQPRFPFLDKSVDEAERIARALASERERIAQSQATETDEAGE